MLLENNLSDAIAEFSEGEKKMKQYLRIESITDLMGVLPREEVVHPLVTLVNFDDYKSQLPIGTKVILGFYAVVLANGCQHKVWYGQRPYDFSAGNISVSLPDKQLPLEQMNRK